MRIWASVAVGRSRRSSAAVGEGMSFIAGVDEPGNGGACVVDGAKARTEGVVPVATDGRSASVNSLGM